MDFDLPNIQKVIRDTRSQRDLYLIWDWVCRLREDKKGPRITMNELEEIRDHVFARIREIANG